MTTDVPVLAGVLGKLDELDRPVEAVDELELTTAEREQGTCVFAREAIASSSRLLGAKSHGDVVYVEDGVAVVVVDAPEDVLEVSPGATREWALSAYRLGNRHRPVRFLGDAILTPYDRSSAEVLRVHGVATRRAKRGLLGERCRAFMHHHHGHLQGGERND